MPCAFSSASCTADLIEPGYMFGSFFVKGVRILHDFLKKPTRLPAGDIEKKLLRKLLDYLLRDQEGCRVLVSQ